MFFALKHVACTLPSTIEQRARFVGPPAEYVSLLIQSGVDPRARRIPRPPMSSATGTGRAPDAWRRARSPDRHARGFLRGRLDALGKYTNPPHADRARDPPGPGGPACSCRAACRSPRSPARREHRPEPGSSARQNRKHPRQRQTVHLPVDDHPRAIGQRDLHPSRRRRIPRGSTQQRRLHNHRHQLAGAASLLAKLTPPGEHQVGVHVVAPRHNRHRNPGW